MQLHLRSLSIAVAALALFAAFAAPADAAQTKKTTKKKVTKKAPAKVVTKTAPKPVAALKPVAGTWFLNDQGKEVRSTKIVLTPHGTFQFIGSGWKSEGTYSFKENQILLQWTKVDAQTVKPGTMKKTLTLSEDLAGFQIDKFNYRKSA